MSSGLLPTPQFLEWRPGSVTWASPLRLATPSTFLEVCSTWAEDLGERVGWEVIFSDGAESDVLVRHEPAFAREEYRVTIGAPTLIEAATPNGVAHALTVVGQLAPPAFWSASPETLGSAELPCAVVHDWPSFEWRGAHLDVARHYFDVATVCRFLDQIAAHRLNRLHLHLNDDQGWRVEVPEWPWLTERGSTRRSSPLGHESEGRDDGVAHGGVYSVQDLATIRRHAAKRFVAIVPEIDLPGHAQAVLAAYPELGNTGERHEVWTRWGISEHVLNVGASALLFAEEVVRYVAGLFPDSAVHIGGDECPTEEWEHNAVALAVMREHGFIHPRQLQGLFTKRMTDALLELGREVIAWDEVLDAEVPPGVTIASWRGVAPGLDAARRGLPTIMAPMEYLYFDWLSSDDPTEPVAVHPRPYVTTWEKVYGFSVYPEGISDAQRTKVRGAQAQVWTEYIATRDRLDYMAFPRMAAFSEVVWGTAGALEEFRPRLVEHLARLDAMGVRYRPLDLE